MFHSKVVVLTNTRAKVDIRDLLSEAWLSVTSRSLRSALTSLGVAIGVGAFVITLGLTSTTQAEVNSTFTSLDATQVVVSDTSPQNSGMAFPMASERLLDVVPGVLGSGLIWQVGATLTRDAELPTNELSSAAVSSINVIAASPGAFFVSGARMSVGRAVDGFDEANSERVVVLGEVAARSLGIGRFEPDQGLLIDGLPFAIVGILRSVTNESALLSSVIVPASTAKSIWGNPSNGSQVDILTRRGAATVVENEAPVVLRPDDPGRLSSVTATNGLVLQSQIGGELSSLLAVVGAIALLMGMIGIASTTLLSVLERIFEIGLRRALGASRKYIACQFLAESGLLGALGGIAGTSVAIIVIVIFARTKGWAAVVDPKLVLLAPVAGMITGLAAGLYPALRASKMDPVDALRR